MNISYLGDTNHMTSKATKCIHFLDKHANQAKIYCSGVNWIINLSTFSSEIVEIFMFLFCLCFLHLYIVIQITSIIR